MHILPLIEATLNFLAFVFILLGYAAIKRRDVHTHKRCMLSAVICSAAFLTLYLIYHFTGDPKSYTGTVPYLYYGILITHVLLAVTVPFLVGKVLYHAWKGQFDAHRKLARWTLPIWSYVSVTGVIIYLMVHI